MKIIKEDLMFILFIKIGIVLCMKSFGSISKTFKEKVIYPKLVIVNYDLFSQKTLIWIIRINPILSPFIQMSDCYHFHDQIMSVTKNTQITGTFYNHETISLVMNNPFKDF